MRTVLQLNMLKFRELGHKTGESRSLAMSANSRDFAIMNLHEVSLRTIRTPMARRSHREALVSRSSRSTSVLRQFVISGEGQGDLVVQLTPCMSAEAARSNVSKALTYLVIRRGNKLSIDDATVVADFAVNDADAVFAYELTLVEPSHSANVKFAAACVENIAFTFLCTSRYNSWNWRTIETLASIQATKVRQVIGNDEPH